MAADPDIAGRREGDGPLRAAILACVLIVCFVILAHLAALFWLSLADGSPGATAWRCAPWPVSLASVAASRE